MIFQDRQAGCALSLSQSGTNLPRLSGPHHRMAIDAALATKWTVIELTNPARLQHQLSTAGCIVTLA